MPRQSSRTSWNPAVPPPPVPGGWVGNDLCAGCRAWCLAGCLAWCFARCFDGLGDGDGDGEADGDGLGLGATAPGTLALGVGVFGARLLGAPVLGAGVLGTAVPGVVARDVAVPGEVALGDLPEVAGRGVPVAELGGVADPRPPGENDGGAVDGVPDEQADSDTGPAIAKTAQPSTVPRMRRRP